MKKSTKLIIGISSIVAIICVAAVLVFAGTGKGKSEYNKHITASQKYLDELNYEKAIAELELAIEIEPNNAEAYVALAEVYMEMGDKKSAIVILEEAKGKVTDVAEVEGILNNLLTETVQLDDGRVMIRAYDADGREIKRSYYKADGSLDFYLFLEYDADRREIKWSCYKADGSLNYYVIPEYDANGKCIKETWYWYDENDRIAYINEHDADKEVIKQSYYNADGSLDYYIIPEYDVDGIFIKETYYDENDRIDYINEYDADGREIKWSYYKADGSLDYYVIPEYDVDGICIKETYYDENGNQVATYQY